MQPNIGIGLDEHHKMPSRFYAMLGIRGAFAVSRVLKSVLLASSSDAVAEKRQDARAVFEVGAHRREGHKP